MRVIAGKARGRALKAPQGLETRPTSDKAREAIFGSIQFDIAGARVLDLFAGSGAMGIEALSRGAAEAVFVDSSREAAAAIRENLKNTGLKGELAVTDFRAALKGMSRAFDFIFIDPPYRSGYYQEAVAAIIDGGLLAEHGRIILEHDGTLDVDGLKGVEAVKDKKYGKAHVTTCVAAEG